LARENFRLPLQEARTKARQFINESPAGGYTTIIEDWHQLSGLMDSLGLGLKSTVMTLLGMLPSPTAAIKPGLSPWGPHVRFRRVQILVREGSPLVKLRNSARAIGAAGFQN
jgi:hypothetical protein